MVATVTAGLQRLVVFSPHRPQDLPHQHQIGYVHPMVATVVNLTSASVTVHYFRREGHGLNRPANDDEAGEDYYARDEHRKASRWRGSGAAALGLRGHVEPGEFRRVLQGHVPGTDIRLGRLRDGTHEHRPGLDITLSAPKSVSLEALRFGPGNARA